MSAAFHILQSDNADQRLCYLAELCESISQTGKQVLIYTDLPALLERVNYWLWAYKPSAFLPHNYLTLSPQTNIQLAHGSQHAPADVLVNLSETVPPQYASHPEIIEVVTQDPRVLNLCRRHYQFYQNEGLTLTTLKSET